MTKPVLYRQETIKIDAIDEDRRFLRAMIKAIGGDARARLDHNPARVARYANALREGATFPAILLVEARDGKLFLLDGFHRLEASKAVGRATIGAIAIAEADFWNALPVVAQTLPPAGRFALLFGRP